MELLQQPIHNWIGRDTTHILFDYSYHHYCVVSAQNVNILMSIKLNCKSGHVGGLPASFETDLHITINMCNLNGDGDDNHYYKFICVWVYQKQGKFFLLWSTFSVHGQCMFNFHHIYIYIYISSIRSCFCSMLPYSFIFILKAFRCKMCLYGIAW